MGIAKNINSIKQTKENLKTEINKRGGDITNNTPFAKYPDFIKNIGIEYKPIGFAKETIDGSIKAKTLGEAKAKTRIDVTAKDSVIIGSDWVERGGGNEE